MELRPYHNTPVRIYWNFHRKLYSVQSKVNGRWKVVGHTQHLALLAPTYKVSQAGRARVLREKRKNVHAFIYGTLFLDMNFHIYNFLNQSYGKLIRYNPYQSDCFEARVTDGAEPIWVPLRKTEAYEYDILTATVREAMPSIRSYS
jgi:hypothetical protein